ncbi:MAG: biotin--[acetyl-CoA-carboxylase] ligase [Oscillospiraceae bacterium]|jgi:BirA family biotin operon repressor/biotin-[acetyl-CoA-carboxylase] ligase|nr:biotin--[acetyl-CoA-carboxylase] ligase [Oscillospiraceae bacterium]
MNENYPSLSLIRQHLYSGCKDCPIHVFEQIDSTNTEAKRGHYPLGSVLLAKEQTGGRGRLGKSFFSPAGGIYVSVVIKPWETDIDEMTTAAGFAVIAAIEKATSIKTEKRRINDIYLDGLKICGILAEGVTNVDTAAIEAVVIGAGLNVFPPQGGFSPELNKIAGALCQTGQARVDKNKIAAEIISALLLLK